MNSNEKRGRSDETGSNGIVEETKGWIGRLSTAICALLMIAALWTAWGTKEAPEPIAYAASPASHQAVPMAYNAEEAVARADYGEAVSIQMNGVKEESFDALSARAMAPRPARPLCNWLR